jgi:hypothetical protein
MRRSMAVGMSPRRVTTWPPAELARAMPSDGARVAPWGRARLCAVLWKRERAQTLVCHGGGGWSWWRPAGRQMGGAREGEGGRCRRGRGADLAAGPCSPIAAVVCPRMV